MLYRENHCIAAQSASSFTTTIQFNNTMETLTATSGSIYLHAGYIMVSQTLISSASTPYATAKVTEPTTIPSSISSAHTLKQTQVSIGVGITVGVIAFIVAIIFGILLLRKRRQRTPSNLNPPQYDWTKAELDGSAVGRHERLVEISSAELSELQDTSSPVELESREASAVNLGRQTRYGKEIET
jgi:hypothetical protein